VAKSLTITRYRPLSEIVCDKLRQAITSGELRPGQRLRQEELANRMGVSRMPVREALHRLAKEGLVEFPPHRGAVVRRHSLRELGHVFDALGVLQRTALELVVKRITDDEIAALDRLQATITEKLTAGRTSEVVSLNYRFHRLVFEACRLPKLLECIESLWDWYPSVGARVVVSRGWATVSEHEEILAALRARDMQGLQGACAVHFESGVRESKVLFQLPTPPSKDEWSTR